MTYLVVLVHGTWGKAHDAWYLPSEEPTSFTARLAVALNEGGIDRDALIFVPHEWNGGNTHSDRLEGAAALASKLIELKSQYEDAQFHLIAHSHGGNVVLKAIEIYLREAISANVPTFFDREDIVSASHKFLEDYSQGKYAFCSQDDGMADLVRGLSDQLAEISERKSRPLRFLFFTDDSIWDLQRGSLRGTLRRIFTHIYTHPDQHRIRSVTTLGTPFYEKTWRLSGATKFTERLLHFLFYIYLTALPSYFWILVIGALAATVPGISWIGFDPLHWHWGILLIGGIFTLWSAWIMSKADALQLPRDTNLYFDEAAVSSYLDALRDRKICRVLNVHASYLDEAYCVLSAYPLLSSALTAGFADIGKPRFWAFTKVSRGVGISPWSTAARIRRLLHRFLRMAVAFAIAIAYPIRYITYRFSMWYVARRARTDLRVLGFGLPPPEYSTNAIDVTKVLKKSYLDTYSLDVCESLSQLRLSDAYDRDRFSFLWNDDDLDTRVAESVLAKLLCGPLDRERSRQLLALEERTREFFGVTGLRHSLLSKRNRYQRHR